MDSITMTRIRPAAIGTLPTSCAALGKESRRLQAPTGAVHGTGLSIAGTREWVSSSGLPAPATAYAGNDLTGRAAFTGVRTTDLPVSPPRGAPV